MIKLESTLVFLLQLLAYVIVGVIAITSYIVIGVIYCIFPVYILFVLMKSLWYKTCGKLYSVFKHK